MEVFFYQAECGDAARIRFLGNDGKNHNIFIDAGYNRTYLNILSSEIDIIKNNRELIDVWIISHIHDDHIGGIETYIDAIQKKEISDIVQKWYYNPPRVSLTKSQFKPLSVSEVKSIKQGDKLMEYISEIGKLPNSDICSELSFDLFGMKIIVLSPSINKLKKLRDKYLPNSFKILERSEIESISEAVASPKYDYDKTLASFDLNKWKEDDSIENGSSISLLTEFQGKRILWLADSHPSDVVTSLKKLGFSNENKLQCEWVKVSHHGSRGNNSNELYDIINCENYLISSNGENKHCLPTKECLARIIRNSNRPKNLTYNFCFTYDDYILRSIFKIDGEDIFRKWNFKTNYIDDKKYMKFVI